MKTKLLFALSVCLMTACTLTPEQQAARQAKQIKAQQKLSVEIAKQCDLETAQLMEQVYDPPISQTEQEKTALMKRYTQKINDPMYQACNKLAWDNYKKQIEIEEMRRYYDERPHFYPWHYCYACW